MPDDLGDGSNPRSPARTTSGARVGPRVRPDLRPDVVRGRAARRTSRTPGAYLRVEVAGESVVVTRDADGALHALLQRVPAPRAPSSSTRGGDAVRELRQRDPLPVPLVDLRARRRLRRAPFLGPVSDADAAAFALAPVAVDSWGGFVFVHLDADSARRTLLDQLGDIAGRVTRYPLAELRRGARVVYEVAANWKVLAENYNECYHCGPVHPELCDLVPSFRRAGGDGLEWERGIPHRDGAYTFTTSGTTTRAPFPDLDEDERVRHKGELAFPNLLLSLVVRPRRVVRAHPTRAGPHDDRVRPAVPSGRDRGPGLRPVRRVRPLGPREPPGLVDLRERAARDGVPRVHPGLVRPDGGPEPGPAGLVRAPDDATRTRDRG